MKSWKVCWSRVRFEIPFPVRSSLEVLAGRNRLSHSTRIKPFCSKSFGQTNHSWAHRRRNRKRGNMHNRSSIVISMAFTCLAHKRNARAKICIQIYLCALDSQNRVQFRGIPGRRRAEDGGAWHLDRSPELESESDSESVDCSTFCCAWQTLRWSVWCDVWYRTLSIWVSGHSLPTPRLTAPSTWLLSQSIVQMSKLHLLCASQKLKQIILPIAFWFQMSLAADWVASGGWWLGGWSTAHGRFRLRWGWWVRRPTVYANSCVYLPPAAPEIMQCLY